VTEPAAAAGPPDDAAPGARLLELVQVMDRLRINCPWDARQTHASLAPHLLEETYEALDALTVKTGVAIEKGGNVGAADPDYRREGLVDKAEPALLDKTPLRNGGKVCGKPGIPPNRERAAFALVPFRRALAIERCEMATHRYDGSPFSARTPPIA